MNRRHFLRGSCLITGLAVFPFIPKWIRDPGCGLWLQTEKNLWQWANPKQCGSSIVLRNFSGIDDARLVLSGSNFARELPTGLGSWSKLRIALRHQFDGNLADITGTPHYAVGLCSGSSNIFQDATTTNWTGCITNAATMSYGYTPKAWNSGYMYPAKRVGSTTSYSVSNLGTHYNNSGVGGTVAGRTLLFIDITVGSPNYTYGGLRSNDPYAGDSSYETYLVVAPLASPAFGSYYYAASDVAYAFDTSAGDLTHVNIAWDKTANYVEICDLSIVKLA